MINKPYSFALVKVVDPDLKEFHDAELLWYSFKSGSTTFTSANE
jgi:hypothetical protein